jgi:hypothetical protein
MQATESPEGAPEAPKEPADPRRATVALVGAIGTGVSGIGFFIVAGGAVIVAQYRGAGLPGITALSVVPRSQLLVAGVAAMALVLSLAFVLVVFLSALWPKTRSSRMRAGVLILLGVLGAIEYTRRVDVRLLGQGGHRLLLLVGLLVLAAGISLTYRHGERGLAEAAETGDRARLLWFSASAFGTAALWCALAVCTKAVNQPTVQAIALLQSHGAPALVGLYVGETAGQNSPNPNRVYVGLVSPRGGDSRTGVRSSGRLIGVPSESVSAFEIGPFEPLKAALARGPRLLAELRRHQAETDPRATTPPP